ncbi:glycoside hydrolase family 31 protein [Lacticigenium naphthae]|uniref:glycoside hydrolase family 31 protein n=1 Tax=Lacticigenium naphthae TaxID=515351 RepID=UPI0003F9238E|nr:glycoside hydrolase family 31 protein [Lacticigenium naphthae]
MDKPIDKAKRLDASPEASREAMVIWENYRFTVLTNRLIRLEYDPARSFEDRATQTVLNRNFPVPEFELKESEEYIEIITSFVHIIFQKEKGGFTKHNFRAEALGNYSLYHSTWYYGEDVETLKGTARTLDFSDGEIELEEGLMNKNGYAIFDDSRSMILNGNGWVDERKKDIVDMYFFGHGRDYFSVLRDYYQLTGSPPLLPRYTLGNWWSRYYPYSQEEYKKLIYQFEKNGYPFSVAVLDMDWHVTDVPPEYGSGWTGYTWNTDLFPEPEEFLSWLKKKGLRTTLNLHPANGVQPYEAAYEEMAEELGVDSANEDPIQFDIADPDFMDAYFRFLHHPHEKIGVDFWWIDWQQGSITKVEGLDPLWMLNHYHYLDLTRNGQRGLIFSRYAGLGSHRYPIGFSGDTVSSWDTLAFQPYFTATASNVGYGWWSHDIGGHMSGTKDDELYVRWVQFGVFSPINRLHSQNGDFSGKEPWRYGPNAQTIVREFLRLRHQLVPYLYTMNVLNHTDNLPLMRPMYYHHPWTDEAYQVENQYYFGTQLIVAPITKPINKQAKMAHVKMWLPEGLWLDFFNGRVYEGDRKLDMFRPLDTIPVLAKTGAIVPMNHSYENALTNPKKMDIRIFAGSNGSFSLIEDDGGGQDPEKAITRISMKWHGEEEFATIHISAPEGDLSSLPVKRKFKLSLVGFKISEDPIVWVEEEEVPVTITRHEGVYTLEIPEMPVETDYTIQLNKTRMCRNDYRRDLYEFLDQAQLSIALKEKIYSAIRKATTSSRAISALIALDLHPVILEAITEIIWANPDDIYE